MPGRKTRNGNRICLLREALNLTQTLLASACGVVALTVSRWERGDRKSALSVQEEEILRSLEVLASHPDVDKERLRAFLASPMEILSPKDFIGALKISPVERASAHILCSRMGRQGPDILTVMGLKNVGNLFRRQLVNGGSTPRKEGRENG